MKLLKSLIFAVFLLTMTAGAQATTIYAGTWNVDDGPSWFPNGSQPILTAQDAAALLFGGNPLDYLISTIDNQVANIDFNAWYSIWGGPAQIFSQSYSQDTGVLGVYDTRGDSSAYIADHCFGGQCINYAFRVNNVPVPASLPLLGLGLIVLGYSRRKAS